MAKQQAHSERAHSDVVGGSTADRRINCPGSFQMEKKVPETLRKGSSSYADEGTALHEAIQFILDEDIRDPFELLDREFNGYKMTRQRIREALEPALDFFDALDEELAAEGGLQFLTEQRCQMPGIPDAFGTADIVGRSDKRSVILDWKFGQGVPVSASYTEEDGSKRVNAQLMFYARAALHTCPTMFENNPDWPVDLYIVQPRAQGHDTFSKATVTVKQLEEFRLQLVAAVCEAQSDTPRTRRGPWCRFADCKAVCPHHTGPLLDLGKLDLDALKKNRPGEVEPVVPADWAKLFGLYLPVCDAAEEVIRTIRAQAHLWLEQGNQIVDRDGKPAYKLVPKRATENYVDEAGAVRHAIGLGAKEADIYEPATIKSPAQLGKVLEPLVEGKTKKERTEEARRQIAQFTSAVSSGTTLAKITDGRPDVTPTPTLVNDLAKKLGTL